jgi:cytochrome P450
MKNNLNTNLKKMPDAGSVLFYRQVVEMLSKPLQTLSCLRNKYGGIFRLRILHKKFIVIEDPGYFKTILQEHHKVFYKYDLSGLLTKFLGDGLITNNGPTWLQQRRTVQPAFHKHQLAGISDIIHNELDKLICTLKKGNFDNPIDICKLFMELNFGIMAGVLFGEKAENEIKLLSETMNELAVQTDKQVTQIIKLPLIIPSPANLRFKKARKKFDTILYSLINKRKKEIAEGITQGQDILQMLLESGSGESGEPMPDKQIRDELTTLFMAGYETTSQTLGWLFFQLAGNPEISARIRSEMNNQVPDNLLPPNHPPILNYTSNLIKETMRFYPAVWLMVRKNIANAVLGEYAIHRGSVLLLNVYGMHHNETYWEKPEEFRPDRFNSENMNEQIPYSYLPFGMGPRLCIGQPFSMILMQIVVSRLINSFDCTAAGNIDIEMEPRVTLRPKPHIYVRLTPVMIPNH